MYSTRIVPFGTIWGIKHLNMNLEHSCTSLSALFDMYSLNMSTLTNSTTFSIGTRSIFPKICHNKAKWHKNDYKLVKNLISSVV